FFFSSRRRHTRWPRDWSSDVCSSDLRYPDLEELVQVGAEDRQELEPLEPRVRGVGGLFEHPRVELEPGQLAVEVVIRRERRGDKIGRASCRERVWRWVGGGGVWKRRR